MIGGDGKKGIAWRRALGVRVRAAFEWAKSTFFSQQLVAAMTGGFLAAGAGILANYMTARSADQQRRREMRQHSYYRLMGIRVGYSQSKQTEQEHVMQRDIDNAAYQVELSKKEPNEVQLHMIGEARAHNMEQLQRAIEQNAQ